MSQLLGLASEFRPRRKSAQQAKMSGCHLQQWHSWFYKYVCGVHASQEREKRNVRAWKKPFYRKAQKNPTKNPIQYSPRESHTNFQNKASEKNRNNKIMEENTRMFSFNLSMLCLYFYLLTKGFKFRNPILVLKNQNLGFRIENLYFKK